ncbi:MAG: hypothetical protein LBT47_03700 [Deltaproteobacteria bacterium]|nr:hypothetical protein [Deltaproteobacteria bacterium]
MKKFFLILTLTLLAAIVGLGLMFLAWLFHWSMWLGSLGPILFLLLPGLYILISRTLAWREKKIYEKSVLKRERAVAGPLDNEEDSELVKKWDDGLKSAQELIPGGVKSNFPWYMIMGSSDSGKSSLLAASGLVNNPGRGDANYDRVEFKPKSGYDFVFSESGVFLDVGGSFLDQTGAETISASNRWTKLVELIAKTRSRRGLAGVIVTVPADRLKPGGEALIHDYACRLRNRLAKLTWGLDRSFPVWVVVTKTDLCPGLGRALAILERKGTLAGSAAEPKTLFGGPLAHLAAGNLAAASRDAILDNLEEPGALADLLSAPASAAALEAPLKVFMEAFSQAVGTISRPQVTGVYFCRVEKVHQVTAVEFGPENVVAAGKDLVDGHSGLQPETGSGFSDDDLRYPAAPSVIMMPSTAGFRHSQNLKKLLGPVLSSHHPMVKPLNLPGTVKQKKLGWGIALYLLVLFIISILILVNVSHNRAISTAVASARSMTIPRINLGELDWAYGQSRLIDRLNATVKERFWPGLGPYRGGEFIEHLTSSYRREFETVTDSLVDGLDSQLGSASDRQSPNFTLSLRQLLWLSSVFREFLEGNKDNLGRLFEAFPALTPDFNGPSRRYWNLVYSELLWDYLGRQPDREKILKYLNRLELIIARGVPTGNDDNLDWLTGWVDNLPESRAVSLASGLDGSVLSRLVRHGALAELAPSYTARGRLVVFGALSQLRRLYRYPEVFENRAEEFSQAYERRYLGYWKDFARASVDAGRNLETPSELKILLDNAIRLLNENLEDFMGQPETPAWILNLELETAQGLVHREVSREAKSDIGGLSGLLESANSLSDDLSGLRKLLEPVHYQDAELLGRVMGGSQPYKDYHALLETITGAIFNKPEDAMVIAAAHFGGATFGNAAESPFSLAETALRRYLTFQYSDNDNINDDPIRDLVSVQLVGLRRLLVNRAAETLGRHWENEVRSPVRFMTEGEARRRLYEPGGLIDVFLAERAAPFLNRHGDIYTSAEWEGIRFPFTSEFLSLIAVGRSALNPTETLEASYDTRIDVQNVSVNPGAKEKPESVIITLKAPDGIQKLENYNFPSSKVFKYEPGKSGELTIDISFPSLALTVAYPGFDGFAFFLRDAFSGEYILTPDDFPTQAERLRQEGVEAITIRMAVEGGLPILRFVDFAEAPELPVKITDPGLI